MENASITITAKNDGTLEITRDTAKVSKTLANLLTCMDETCQKTSIRLEQFEASTLDKVFEWCEEHSGAGAAGTDFVMQANFSNKYARCELTQWQADFLRRYDAHKWKLAVAASYLDVTFLYYAVCFAISESLQGREWDREVPESVDDDVMCNVLRFFSHEDIFERGPLQPRWKRFIEMKARALPLKVVSAEIEVDHIEVSPTEVFDDLDSLCRYAADRCYAFEKLYIRRFREADHAVVQAFLNQSSARLRVRSLSISGLPSNTPAFRTSMAIVQKLTKRLNLLEEVRLDLSCHLQAKCLDEEPGLLAYPCSVQKLYVYIYTNGRVKLFFGFIAALHAACNRWIRHHTIELGEYLRNPLPLLSKVHEKFAEDGESTPLLITATVPTNEKMLDGLRQFAVNRGFEQVTTARHACAEGSITASWLSACEYVKTRGNGWKIAVKYNDEVFTIKIEEVTE